MKNYHLIGGVAALALLTIGGAAHAQTGSVNNATPWQFRTESTADLQNNTLLIQQQRDRLKGIYPATSSGGSVSGGSGLLGASSGATNNYFQTINENIVSNSCAASAGSSLSCGGTASGGGNVTSASQTTSGTTNTSKTNVSDNTLTSSSTTTNNGGQ